MRVRIVLDTNVVMSALLWSGTPHQLLQAIRSRSDVRVYSSQALLEELTDVLMRPSVSKRLAAIDRTPREVIADLIAVVDLIEVTNVPRVVPSDPDDDQVIAAAVAAHADLIVSGDRDLLSLGTYQAIVICSPADAMARVATV
jgi:putative PIN family toxin of toxin-antitoxin system